MRLLRKAVVDDNIAPLNYDAVSRQQTIYNLIVNGYKANTLLLHKAAIVAKVVSNDPIRVAKLMKNWNTIKDTQWLNSSLARKFALEASKSYSIGSPINITPKRRVIVMLPIENKISLERVDNVNVNIKEFESMVFSGRINAPYRNDGSFLQYMLSNLKWYADSPLTWQHKLLKLLTETNSEFVAIQAFYTDSVAYMSTTYDTSFVPKYPVLHLRAVPQKPYFANFRASLDYYRNLQATPSTRIPDEYLSFFRIIPFISGYQVLGDGTLRYVPTSTTVDWPKFDACRTDLLDNMIDRLITNMSMNDLVHYCISGNSVQTKVLCLMAMRRFTDTITISSASISIPIASYNSLKRVLRFSCNKRLTATNYSVTDKRIVSIQRCQELIKDIAAAAINLEDVAIICSNYKLPACRIGELTTIKFTEAQKFVLLTILKQMFPKNFEICSKYMRSMPEFNSVENAPRFNPTKFHDFLNSHRYVPDVICDRVYEVPMVMSDIANYRFEDPQLAELVEKGDTTLTIEQQAKLLDLLISTDGVDHIDADYGNIVVS